MIVTALKVIGVGAAVGFGTAAAIQVARRPSRRHELPPAPEESCVDAVWAPMQQLDQAVGAHLPLSALLTVSQFPGFHLSVDAQRVALDAVAEYLDAVEEVPEEDDTVTINFPGVEGSSIPDDGMEVVVARALDRVENYRRFAAAAAASALAPACAWPEPFSLDIPDDPREAAVWQSLEQIAVVALAARDETRVRVDVDPAVTVLDDKLEACVPENAVLPLRSPTTLAPELDGDPEDASWQISHATQVEAFALLRDQLSDPDATAPVSVTVAALAPRCPWGDKRRYGLRMTTLWHDVRRLERVADQPQEDAA